MKIPGHTTTEIDTGTSIYKYWKTGIVSKLEIIIVITQKLRAGIQQLSLLKTITEILI